MSTHTYGKMQPSDDSALLREYAENRSDEAFAALVTRHVNLVYSVALRQVGNPHHAEEITQAVFIILEKKAAEVREGKALSSWLFQATHLTANNFLRSEIRRRHREQESHMRTILKESANEIWPRIAPMLETAVAGLKEKDRHAIVLRFYEGRTLNEVGAALGTSEDAAKKRVSRALEKLRKFFTKRGVASTTATIAEAISTNSVQVAPVTLAKTATAIALAKGATASTSTLTLIKGALKVMAWTKAKTAIVTAGIIILAAGTTSVVVLQHHRPEQSPEPQPVASGRTEFPRSSWAFAGYANPESALQSCIWAAGNGDVATLLAGFTPDMQKQFAGRPAQVLTDKDRANFAQMTGYVILDKQELAENKVMFDVDAEGLNETQKVFIERIGSEWRFGMKPKQ
jgi:RNA polymerase sigma factor (sigma-70 family)